MTNEPNVPNSAPTPSGFSIDPSTWVEPKESFAGFVLTSAYRWANEKYVNPLVDRITQELAGTENALSRDDVLGKLADTNPEKIANIIQWDLRVKRLDAVFQLPDGSQADAIRYGGFDLVKWNRRDNTFVPINPNYGKESFISGEWKRIAGTIEPPTLLENKFFNFDFFPSKRFGGSMPAKRVLVPTSVLPPNFQFTGEVRTIPVPQREDDQTQTTVVTEAQTDGTVPGSVDVADAFINFLFGKKNEAASILSQLPPDLRVQSILSGVASGELVKTLAAEGKIVIGADGIINKPA